jgi:hypothetical protein
LMRMSAPHFQSSPAKAGDPVFRGVSGGAEKLRRTGYSALAEYDGGCGKAATSNPYFLRGGMDCFAEPVIGRAFALPVGSH